MACDLSFGPWFSRYYEPDVIKNYKNEVETFPKHVTDCGGNVKSKCLNVGCTCSMALMWRVNVEW